MKKILIVSLAAIFSLNLAAQSPQSGVTLTAAEANKLNGTVEPKINGKPYSQWVSEEKAKQASRMTTNKVVLHTDVANNGGAVDAKTAPVENQETNRAKTTPVSHAIVVSESNAAVTAVEVKTQSINQDKGDGAVTTKVADASKVKVEALKTEATVGAVQAPQPMSDASKTSNGNGTGETKEVKSTDQKPVETKEPAGNSPSTNKTKTD